VIPAERNANPASTPRMGGLFAALRGLLPTQGTGAPSAHRRALPAVLTIAAATLALTAAPAQAARGHVFEKSIGSGPCTVAPGEPCEGKFNRPAGLAVNEATGNIYVVDSGNNRVELFNPKGKLQGELTGPSAEGKGTLTSGSNLITEVSTESGAFTAGEELKALELKALGLPAGTKIVAVKEGGVLEVSESATETGPASLTAHQQFFLEHGVGGIAVDNACFLHNLTEASTPKTCREFDPSNGDVYVASGEFGLGVLDKFSAAGVYLGQITETPGLGVFNLVTGVAVDPNGRLFLTPFERENQPFGFDIFTDAEPNTFISPFVPVTLPPPGRPGFGTAVDSEDSVYLATISESPVVKVSVTGKLLNGELDPESILARNGLATEVPSNDVYVDNVFRVKRLAPDGSELETFGESQMTNGQCQEPCTQGNTDGVAVNSSTGQVYVSEANSNLVLAYDLKPPGPPEVVTESVSEITSDSATLAAELNPESLPSEPDTTYRFEYGPCTGAGGTESCATSPYLQTPSASLAASFEVDTVTAQVQALAAGHVYHYRVTAENAISRTEGKPAVGAERLFTTQGNGEFLLPDGRQWEMVSPPEKNGALIAPIGPAEPLQSAADGGAISYATDIPTESEPQGNFTGQVFSTRGAGGWSSRDIELPHTVASGVPSSGVEARFFSEDLSAAVLQPFGSFDPAVSPEASEQTPYLRSNYAGGGEPCVDSSGHCYSPLLDAKNVTSGEPFGEEGKCPPQIQCGPEFVGAARDLRHVVLRSSVALTPGGGEGLYEWSAGRPAGEQLQSLHSAQGARLGLQTAFGVGGDAARNAVSHDGSRVFYSTGNHLFMRDTVTQKTLQLDLPEPEPACPSADHCGEGPINAEFQGASSEGNRVLFTDTQKLTADGGVYSLPRIAGNTAADLYECEIVESAGEPACNLTDLTPAGHQLGTVLGASEDGSWVYFAANSVLQNNGVPVHGAVPGGCLERESGRASATCDLYVRHGGETKLVAVLSGPDNPDWADQLFGLTARVSPNGQWLAFMSQRSLTGYDNRDAVSGKRDQEVYLYDGATGGLVCASCNPTGARPHGVEFGRNNIPLAGTNWGASTWLAADIPTWSLNGSSEAIYQSRYLSDSGRLFFDSSDGLVPKDTNGTGDVYEYEPEGVPSGAAACSAARASGSEVFRSAHPFTVEAGGVKQEGEEGAGCVALISSGASTRESGFIDASQSGGDVFFLTTSKLASQDTDDALDVYDAHECTDASPCPVVAAAGPPPCNTEASCKAAPSVQPEIFGPPASATFNGPENLTPPAAKVSKKTVKCPKGKVRNKHGKCLKKPRSKRHKAKRPVHTNRRAG
jgi:DNA-binding beta-propeller fold protein YncE